MYLRINLILRSVWRTLNPVNRRAGLCLASRDPNVQQERSNSSSVNELTEVEKHGELMRSMLKNYLS